MAPWVPKFTSVVLAKKKEKNPHFALFVYCLMKKFTSTKNLIFFFLVFVIRHWPSAACCSHKHTKKYDMGQVSRCEKEWD